MAKRIRPQALPGVTYRMPTACGKIYVTITRDGGGRPFEIFVRFGKAGHCGAAIFDGMTKLISYALRSGMDPSNAVKALSGIVCTRGIHTCLNAVAEAFKEVLAPPLTGFFSSPLPRRPMSLYACHFAPFAAHQ